MAVDNPWAPEHWNISAQGRYIQEFGMSVATRTARKAGSYIGATKPTDDRRIIERQWILSRKISTDSSGGGGGNTNVIGAGSSGEGPPD